MIFLMVLLLLHIIFVSMILNKIFYFHRAEGKLNIRGIVLFFKFDVFLQFMFVILSTAMSNLGVEDKIMFTSTIFVFINSGFLFFLFSKKNK